MLIAIGMLMLLEPLSASLCFFLITKFYDNHLIKISRSYIFFNNFIFLHFVNRPYLIFPGGTSGKEPACQCRRCKRGGFDPWVGKIRWRRKWQPISVFVPGQFLGQSSVVGYSPWDCKEQDLSEAIQHAYMQVVSSVLQLKQFCNE